MIYVHLGQQGTKNTGPLFLAYQQRQKCVFNPQIKSSVTVSCRIDGTKPVFWLGGNNPDYFTAWFNTPLGEMWHNSNSCSTWFHYFDIVPSGSVPVTQRWTFLLILITARTAHHEGTQSSFIWGRRKKSGCRVAYRCVQIQISKHYAHSMLTTKACTQRSYFGLSKNIPQISLSPASRPFLRTLKSHNHFPFSSHSVPPQKAPDSFCPYQ